MTLGRLEGYADHLILVVPPETRDRIRRSEAARARALGVMQWAADVSGLAVFAVTSRGRASFLAVFPGVVEISEAS